MPQNRTVRTIVVSGVLAAIAIALAVTRIGFIPMPSGINATILHVPAIVGGVIEGPVAGLAIGGIFGIFSFLQATTPLFQNPLIAIGPRLLIGVVAYFAYRAAKPINEVFALALAGLLGTATNTGLVLGLAITVPGPNGVPYLTPQQAWTAVITQAWWEAILAMVITVAVGLAVRGAGRMRRSTV
ncbi:MAG: hypothetical protein AUH85_03700 [Chloroflexi bacterium 13_1_40CM_4_68_4]|nr:MAG: hypothetical protein AUH85_03700 [Chloroflexi bacterium 13_1_40CM_4_68_4]